MLCVYVPVYVYSLPNVCIMICVYFAAAVAAVVSSPFFANVSAALGPFSCGPCRSGFAFKEICVYAPVYIALQWLELRPGPVR